MYLPAADGVDFHLGTYAEGTNGALFLNPLKTTAVAGSNTWLSNGVAFVKTKSSGSAGKDPYNEMQGTIGDVNYFPGTDGDFKETQ